MSKSCALVLALGTALGTASAAPRSSSRPRGAAAATVRQALGWYGKDMQKDIRGGHTPHWAVVNVNGRVTRDVQYDYGKGKAGIMRVPGLGASGRFKVVTLLPVSGHVGWANAQKYARSNRYSLTLADEQGNVRWQGKKASTGLVTAAVFELKLQKGKNVFEFAPDGSLGAGGYLEGRRYVIHWDGK